MWGIEPISLALQATLSTCLATASAAFRHSRSHADGCALDDITNFIEGLCNFVLLIHITEPDHYLQKVYEPSFSQALVDYRALSCYGWTAYFRLDYPSETLKLVYFTTNSGPPLIGLRSLLDRL